MSWDKISSGMKYVFLTCSIACGASHGEGVPSARVALLTGRYHVELGGGQRWWQFSLLPEANKVKGWTTSAQMMLTGSVRLASKPSGLDLQRQGHGWPRQAHFISWQIAALSQDGFAAIDEENILSLLFLPMQLPTRWMGSCGLGWVFQFFPSAGTLFVISIMWPTLIQASILGIAWGKEFLGNW